MKRKRFSVIKYFQVLFTNESRRKPFLVSVIVFIVVFAGLAAYGQAQDESQKDLIIRDDIDANTENEIAVVESEYEGTEYASSGNGANESSDATGMNATDKQEAVAIFVDVGGAVRVSGLFALPAGSRIADAIDAAGGLTEDANIKYLNRATILLDGDRLYVPTETEILERTAPPSAGQITQGGASTTAGSASGAQTTVDQSLININTAGVDELQTLSGVGPATAQKIIDYRTSNGGFKQIEDIMNVSGIGRKTFEKFCEYIVV